MSVAATDRGSGRRRGADGAVDARHNLRMFWHPSRARGVRRLACRVLFCESGWRRTLQQQGTTGSSPTAGRRRGKLMACVGLRFLRAREAASPLFFFANPVGGERCSSKELRGHRRLLAGAAAS